MTTKELDCLGKPYRIYADVLEYAALRQFTDAMKLDCVVKGALMPDAHSGYTLPIGAVVVVEGFVFPSFVGYDIGCGMCALQTPYCADDVRAKAQEIFDHIYHMVPVGFAHNTQTTRWPLHESLPQSDKMEEIFNKNGLLQLGSLGGGNHFIEIGADETDGVWVVIHSGSRGIGHATASHYMRLASGSEKAREGHFGLAVDSTDGKNYIKDLAFCLAFALENRREMMRRVVGVLDSIVPTTPPVEWDSLINRNHNHAEQKNGLWIHRKGATHAEAGMLGVIPGNMRDGSFIVIGKGNPEALWSSSHGAGRALSRSEAKRTLTMEGFGESMAGVVALVTHSTLDESPAAYKPIEDVMRLQESMVEVVCRVMPIINVKG